MTLPLTPQERAARAGILRDAFIVLCAGIVGAAAHDLTVDDVREAEADAHVARLVATLDSIRADTVYIYRDCDGVDEIVTRQRVECRPTP